jgi:hypothetical protein
MNLPVVNNNSTDKIVTVIEKGNDVSLFRLELLKNVILTEMQFQDQFFRRFAADVINNIGFLQTLPDLVEYQNLTVDEIKRGNLAIIERFDLFTEFQNLTVDEIKASNSKLTNSFDTLIESGRQQRETLQRSMRAGLANVAGILKDSLALEKEKFDLERLNALRAEESRLEAREVEPAAGKEKEEKKESSFLGGILLAIAGIISGFVVGFIDSLKKTLAFASATLKGGFLKIITLLKETSLFKTIQFYYSATVTTIAGVFKNLFNLIKNSNFVQAVLSVVDDIKKYFNLIRNTPIFDADDRAIVDTIKNIAAKVKNFAMNFLRIGDAAAEVGKIVSSIAGKVIGVFQSIKTFVVDTASKVGTWLKNISGISTFFGKVGVILGKIFFPLTLILTLWDTIKGAIEGFEKEGIIGGIKGALGGLISSIVGVPLNLLKDLFSWIAEKLGFEGISKALDSFDFVTLIKGGIEGIFNFFKNTFEFIGSLFSLEKVKEVLGNVGNFFMRIFGGIVEFLASIAEKIPGVGAGIAEAIRKLKPEETPAAAPTATPTPSGGLAGAQVQASSQAVEASKGSAPVVVTNAPTSINAPTSTSMNSQTFVPATPRRSRPSPTGYDYSDPIMLGA